MKDISLQCSGQKFCHLEIWSDPSILVCILFFCFPANALYPICIFSYRFSFLVFTLYHSNGIYILFCGIIVVIIASRIRVFCIKMSTAKEFTLIIKDMNDNHFGRSNKMPFLIL